MGDSTAAIVWGMPVKLMHFLRYLDAYRRAIPTIHTLRLSNQFGKGKNAGITKLPKELIGFIEEELLAIYRRGEGRVSLGWTRSYHCYKRSCRPRGHRNVVYGPTYEDLSDFGGSDYSFDDSDSERDIMSEGAFEACYGSKADWPIDLLKHMKDNGNNDILRKHFGLEAFVMHEVLDPSTVQYLRRNNKRYAYRPAPEKATICHLVLPTRTAQWKARLDPDCSMSDYYYGESGSSILVDPNSVALTEEHQRRFARAMLRLALRPSVHPSQLMQEMSVISTIGNSSPSKEVPRPAPNKDMSEEEKAMRDSVTKTRINDLEQSQWPKLMLLSSQTYSEN